MRVFRTDFVSPEQSGKCVYIHVVYLNSFSNMFEHRHLPLSLNIVRSVRCFLNSITYTVITSLYCFNIPTSDNYLVHIIVFIIIIIIIIITIIIIILIVLIFKAWNIFYCLLVR